MPTTPNLAIPYPILADTSDVPRDLKALADRVDLMIGAPVTPTLPVSPVEGQVITYKVGSGDTAAFWKLRYDSSIGDTYKWRVIGGTPMALMWTASNWLLQTGSVAMMRDQDLRLAPPLGGVYDVSGDVMLSLQLSGGASGDVSVNWNVLSAVTMGNVPTMVIKSQTQDGTFKTAPARRMTVAPGDTVLAAYSRGSGTANIYRVGSSMFLMPVRVG